MLRAAALSVVVWSCVSVGCLDASSSVAARSYPTTLTIDPSAFRGVLTCGGTGLHRYVVTLTDVTRGGDAALAAPTSSQPTACTVATSFSLERSVGHAFIGEIDGYDRDDIVAAAPGSRTMLDAATGATVCPVWQASCGGSQDDDGGNPLRKHTIVVELTETLMTGCTPLAPVPEGSTCATHVEAGTSERDAGLTDALASDSAERDVNETDANDAAHHDEREASGEPFDAAFSVDSPADHDFLDASPQVLDGATREGG